MPPAITIRLAHYPSRTSIPISICLDPKTKVSELLVTVNDLLVAETTCPVRYFSKWYFEAKVGNALRFVEIMGSDANTPLATLGITSETILYLEGPLENELSGKALAMISAQLSSVKAELSLLKQLLVVPNRLLSANFGAPMKALWEALKEGSIGTDAIMAIVFDSRCGLECRSTVNDGDMSLAHVTDFNLNEKGGCTPLMLAVFASRVDVVKALLSVGADARAKESTIGRTPMHVAATVGCTSAIEQLITHGVKVDIRRNDGCTPLHTAARNNRVSSIELLILKGADVSAKQSSGAWTPLLLAAENGHTSCIELLIAKGADVDESNKSCRTALHFAASNGYSSCVQMLIDKGADVQAKDEDGMQPLTLFNRNSQQLIMSNEDKEHLRSLLYKRNNGNQKRGRTSSFHQQNRYD